MSLVLSGSGKRSLSNLYVDVGLKIFLSRFAGCLFVFTHGRAFSLTNHYNRYQKGEPVIRCMLAPN